MRVGNLVAVVRVLHDDVGLGKALSDVFRIRSRSEENIPPACWMREEIPCGAKSARRNHRFLRIEHRRQNFVIHLDEPAGFLGDSSVSAATAATR
jgi:hypothetical protein